jgi:hypothetical protein
MDVNNGHDPEAHEVLQSGIELDRSKADCREHPQSRRN